MVYRTGSYRPKIVSQEIESISLHNPIPIYLRIYGVPFLSEQHFFQTYADGR